MNQNNSGYILVLTLMILSIGVLLVTQISHRSVVHIHFEDSVIKVAKAKELARGGVQLAISQLLFKTTATEEKQQKQGAAKPEEKDQKAQQKTQAAGKDAQKGKEEFYKAIIPNLNRWQIFELKEAVDGLHGIVQFSVVCEQGKLDLNQMFDFEEKKFKGEGQKTGDKKKLMQLVFGNIKKFVGGQDLFAPLEKFLKARQHRLNDVTELLAIPEFQKVFVQNVFYEPPGKEAHEKRPLYLSDLFTVFSGKNTLQPWFLSDAVAAAFVLKRAQTGDAEKRERHVVETLKQKDLKDKTQMWDKQLQPFYGKDFKGMPKELQELVDFSFEPTAFFVLSYGTVGGVTQKLVAILERKSPSEQDEAPFIVKKQYWF